MSVLVGLKPIFSGNLSPCFLSGPAQILDSWKTNYLFCFFLCKMKAGILTATSCLYFLCRVKMSETNQQQDELPAYLKDESPAGTASYADISL